MRFCLIEKYTPYGWLNSSRSGKNDSHASHAWPFRHWARAGLQSFLPFSQSDTLPHRPCHNSRNFIAKAKAGIYHKQALSERIVVRGKWIKDASFSIGSSPHSHHEALVARTPEEPINGLVWKMACRDWRIKQSHFSRPLHKYRECMKTVSHHPVRLYWNTV